VFAMPKPLPFPEPEHTPRRGRGQPRSALDPAKRLKHIRVAYTHWILGRTFEWITKHYGVSRRCAQYWCAQALTYDDPEAQTLRDMIRAKGAKR
jgi:hypothetical protein